MFFPNTCEHRTKVRPDKTVKRPSKIKQAAYHEAGHAVAAYLLHERFAGLEMTVVDGPDGSFYTRRRRSGQDKWTNTLNEKYVMIYSAGAIAEQLLGVHVQTTDYIDIWGAVRHAWSIANNLDEMLTHYRQLVERTKKLLEYKPNWAAVQALAQELVERKRIDEKHARHIIQQTINREVAVEEEQKQVKKNKGQAK